MPVPAECQAIADAISGMEGERRGLQDELHHAAPNEKAAIAQQIKALNAKLKIAQNQLTDCIAAHHEPPPPPPLEAIFSGTASLTTSDARAPGPYHMSAIIGLLFNGSRSYIAITTFPAIAVEFDTVLGHNVTTITKIAGGGGSFAAGQVRVPITLRFDHSIDLPFYEEDSDLPLVLSTDPPGSPMAADGNVTLAGTGVFSGGVLSGQSGTLVIVGKVAPVP